MNSSIDNSAFFFFRNNFNLKTHYHIKYISIIQYSPNKPKTQFIKKLDYLTLQPINY